MANTKSFKQKMDELDEILAWFESDKVTLNEAVAKYEAAKKLSAELEKELTEAKNKIEIIDKKFSK